MFSVSHCVKDEHQEDSDPECKKKLAEARMDDRIQKMKNMNIDVHSIFVQGGVNASRGKGRGKGSGRGGYSKSIASFTSATLVPVVVSEELSTKDDTKAPPVSILKKKTSSSKSKNDKPTTATLKNKSSRHKTSCKRKKYSSSDDDECTSDISYSTFESS